MITESFSDTAVNFYYARREDIMDKINSFKPEIRIPVGNSNFAEIRKEGLYYVDKTGLIFELLNSTEKVRLITRPRRFGKTLMMSMLENFFNIEKDSKELFKGLEISTYNNLCTAYMNQYPTIFLSFKTIEGMNFKSACDALIILISNLFQTHNYLFDSGKIAEEDKKIFSRFQSHDISVAELKYSVTFLTRLLYDYYGKQVIILLDEYDVPLAKAADYHYYQEMLDMIRGILQVLKDNDCLKFAILTGCLRISKESIFTGVNNFSTNSVISKSFNKYFGFTEEDVNKFLKDFGVSSQYSTIKEWYDGYNFGGIDMYCPWDVTRYVMDYLTEGKKEATCYWAGSSGNAVIRSFIDKYAKFIKLDIERLLKGESIVKKLFFNLTYGELQDSVDNFWTVLFLSGYLTAEKDADFSRATEDGGLVSVKIPNTEVKQIFTDTIDKWIESATGKAWDASLLIQAISEENTEVMSSEITKILRKTISYFDYSESFYHAFLAGILRGAGCFVRTNSETGEGRSDIILEDPDNDRVFIFELKRTRIESEMECTCQTALKQIEEMRYDDYFLDDYDEIIHYGVVFYKKRCLVKSENQTNSD